MIIGLYIRPKGRPWPLWQSEGRFQERLQQHNLWDQIQQPEFYPFPQWSLSSHHCLNRCMGEFGCLALTPSFPSTSKGVGLQGCSQMGLLYYLSLPTSGSWGNQRFQAVWRLQHLPILPALQASAQKWCSTGSFGNILVNITNAQKKAEKEEKQRKVLCLNVILVGVLVINLLPLSSKSTLYCLLCDNGLGPLSTSCLRSVC